MKLNGAPAQHADTQRGLVEVRERPQGALNITYCTCFAEIESRKLVFVF